MFCLTLASQMVMLVVIVFTCYPRYCGYMKLDLYRDSDDCAGDWFYIFLNAVQNVWFVWLVLLAGWLVLPTIDELLVILCLKLTFSLVRGHATRFVVPG